jgi:hypothetical protein
MESGRGDLVQEQRAEFQEALRDEFIDAVANATGRRVQAFMSATHEDRELICEVFVLEPEEHAESGDADG